MKAQNSPFLGTVFYFFNLFIITACGGGGGGGGGSDSSSGGGSTGPGPSASIQFPPLQSMTEAETVTVYGQSSDANGVARVSINGVTATSSDSFANWQVTVPLALGANTLDVRTEDAAGNSSPAAAQLQIKRTRFGFRQARAIAIDSPRNRALVIDDVFDALIALDLNTGERSVIVDDSSDDTAHAFTTPFSLAVSEAYAFVLDTALTGIYKVDLLTGERRLHSNNTVPHSADPLVSPRSISYAPSGSGERLMVLDATPNSLNTVRAGASDVNGVRYRITRPSPPPLSAPVSVQTYDFDNTFIIDSHQRAIVIFDSGPPTSGNNGRILSDNTTPNNLNPFTFPTHMALDRAVDRLLVSDLVGKSIIAVDIATGARTPFSSNSPASDQPQINEPGAIAYDGANSRAFMIDSLQDIIALSGSDGTRSDFYSSRFPDNTTSLNEPVAVKLDKPRNRALLVNQRSREIIAIDLSNGERSIFSSSTVPNGFTSPSDIAINETAGVAYVVDNAVTLPAVYTVDLDSGSRTLLSNNSVPGPHNPFSQPLAIAVDLANNRLLVSDEGHNAIIAVDISSGARSVFSDSTTPNNTNVIGQVGDIIIDGDNNRALVLDTLAKALIAVDLSDGSRSVLSSLTTPDNTVQLQEPERITLNSANNRVFVTDRGRNAIVSIDLSASGNGVRSIQSSNATLYDPNGFAGIAGIDYDSSSQQLLVSDIVLRGLIAVDVSTGDRVFLSK